MADDDRMTSDRRKNRGRRAAAVIEGSATEVTPPTEAQPMQPEAASASPEPVPPEPVAAASEPPPPPVEEPKPEAAPEPPPEIIAAPPPPPEKPRYALPIAAAGLIGAIFGAGAGFLAPGLTGGTPAVDPARLQRVEQSVAEIARRPAPSPAPAVPAPSNTAEVQALTQRLGALQAELKRRLDAQDQKIAAIPAPQAAAPAPPPVDLSPIAGRLDALERGLQALDGKADAARTAAEPQIRELSERLGQTARRVETTAAAPLFGAVQALGQTFQRGAPFAVELAAVQALGAAPESLQPLRGLAERGAPTSQRLAAQFQPLAAEIARAAQPPSAGGVPALLGGVVRTRSTDVAVDPSGGAAAVEAALRSGDIAGALAAWDKLPEPARKLTEAWAAGAREREAAAKAVRDLQEHALAALRKAAQ